MEMGEFVNENISKKMGVGMFAMFLVSKCTVINIAYVIAAIAVFGIVAQSLIDWRKLSKGENK